ncbi:MAG: O-antigen polymerase [Vulcanimicrobiota bacterium]
MDGTTALKNRISFEPTPAWLAYLALVALLGMGGIYWFTHFFDSIPSHYFQSIVLMILAVFVFLASYIYYKDIFAPVGIFGFSWIFSLGLTSLRLSRIQMPWSQLTWFVFVINVVMFIVGALIVAPLVKNLKLTWENPPMARLWSRKRFFLFIVLAFILAIMVFMLEVAVEGPPPLFAENKTEAYAEFGINFLHYITVTLVIIPSLVYFYIKEYMPGKGKGATKVLLIFMAVVAFFVVMSLMSKDLLFHSILFVMVFANYIKKRKISLKLIAIIMLVIIVGMIGLAEIRFASELLVRLGQLDITEEFYWIAMPYIYITFNFENMNSVINMYDPVNISLGEQSFAPLWTFTMFKHIFRASFESEGSGHLLIQDFNVSTYLESLYIEYGVPGIIIFPFLYGVVTQWIYLVMRKRNSPLFIGLYGCLLNAVAFCFFGNFFAHPTTTFFIIFFVVAYLFCRKKSPRNRSMEMTVNRT